jgi:ribosomal protein L7/L12
VACIKEIRQWTGFGLKDAKDLYVLMQNSVIHQGAQRTEYIKVKPEDYSRAVSGLRNVGFIV